MQLLWHVRFYSAATRVQVCFGTQISFFLLSEVILLSSDPSARLENALPALFLIIITIVINQHPRVPPLMQYYRETFKSNQEMGLLGGLTFSSL